MTKRPEDTLRYHLAAQALLPQAMFVISVMPTYLGALADYKGFSGREIGWVGAADSAGALVSLLVLSAVLQHLDRRSVLLISISFVIITNILNIFLDSYQATLLLRGLHSTASTVVFGLGIAYFSNTAEPERWFAWRATLAVLLQSLLFVLSPLMIGKFGVESLYLSSLLLTPISIWAILSLPSRPQPYRLEVEPTAGKKTEVVKLAAARGWLLAATALFSFYYQPLFIFSERLGRSIGLNEQVVGTSMAVTTLIGIVGSLAVSIQGNRFGRTWPLLLSGLLAIVTAAILTSVYSVGTYWLGLTLFSIVWSYFPCYQLSLVALADPNGQFVVTAQAIAAGTALVASGLTGELLVRFGLHAPGWVALSGMIASLVATMIGNWLLMHSEQPTGKIVSG